MHHSVIALLGYDVTNSMWYGVSKDGRAVVKSSSHSSKFIGAPLSDWDAAKVKPTTILAEMIENDLAITSATLTPRAEHVQNSKIGTKWGGQIALFYLIIESYFPVISKSLTPDNRNLLNTAVNTEPAFFIWLFKVITPDLFFILFYFISFSVSAKGIHVAESLNWNLKAVWMCYGP